MNAHRHRPSSGRTVRVVRRLLVAALLAATAGGSAACLSVSRQDEIRMGRDYSERLDSELPLIREAAIRAGMKPLVQDGRRKVLRGDTTPEEVARFAQADTLIESNVDI